MVEKIKNESFADFKAKEKGLIIARRHIALFHQLHVIKAGLKSLCEDFITIDDSVIGILHEVAGGAKFEQYVKSLKNGSVPMGKIDVDFLPFGVEVFEDKAKLKKYTVYNASGDDVEDDTQDEEVSTSYKSNNVIGKSSIGHTSLADDNANLIFDLLRVFKNTPKDLEEFKTREEVRDFGPEWKVKIYDLIDQSDVEDKDNLKKVFEELCVFDYALIVWQDCAVLLRNPKSKSKKDIEKLLPEYKKYLSMFGAGGQKLYERVEALAK